MMSELEGLTELEARVSAASGADPRIDFDFWRRCTPDRQVLRDWDDAIARMSDDDLVHWASRFTTVAPYTGSIEAAFALYRKVLPGRSLNLEVNDVGGDPVTDAYISGADGYFEEPKTADAHGYANSPALAICLAIVRALIAEVGNAGR